MLDQTMSLPAIDGQLSGLRHSSERAITGLIWLHGPILAAAGWLTSGSVLLALLLWAGITATRTIAHLADPGTARTRAVVTVALCLMPALMVLELDGHPWHIDAHMEFFAALAICAALLDLQAIIVGAGIVAVHHLVLNFVLPALVFPGGGDLGRVLFHAVILLCEAVALGWLIDRVVRSAAAAEASSAEVARLAETRVRAEKQSQVDAVAIQRAAMAKTADAFEAKV